MLPGKPCVPGRAHPDRAAVVLPSLAGSQSKQEPCLKLARRESRRDKEAPALLRLPLGQVCKPARDTVLSKGSLLRGHKLRSIPSALRCASLVVTVCCLLVSGCRPHQ